MRLSIATKAILGNFANINQNILFVEGNTIKTISEMGNISASAVINENIPKRFAIYNLSEFLSVTNLTEEQELTFGDEHLLIEDKDNFIKIKYYYSSEESISERFTKMWASGKVQSGNNKLTFNISDDQMNKIRKASSTLGHDTISITSSDSSKIRLNLLDKNNATSNTFSIDLDYQKSENYNIEEFNFDINISNLKIVPGSYDVSISKLSNNVSVANFKHTDSLLDLEYWIACYTTTNSGE